MKKVLTIGLFSAFYISILYAQHNRDLLIENIMEKLTENSGKNRDYTLLISDLQGLYDNPINLNSAQEEDLLRLPILTEMAVSNFLQYRKEVGQIYSLHELVNVEGFSEYILDDLQYFVKIGKVDKYKNISLKEIFNSSSSNIMLRGQRVLSAQEGYKDKTRKDFKSERSYNSWIRNRYLGSPWRYYLRLESNYSKKIHLRFLAEKDPGEEFFAGTQKRGFDHYTGCLEFNDIGIIKKAIFGDYLAQFGQGLVIWGGYKTGKYGYYLNVNKRNEGIRKYASTNENNFFRGIGVTIEPLKHLNITGYFSSKKIDGNKKQDPKDDEELFTSFLNSGYHRSVSEIEDRKVVGNQVIGGHINYSYNNLKVGANYIYYKFSLPFSKTNKKYNLFSFSGDRGLNYSFYANWRYNRIYLFGEAAFDKNNAKAILAGAIFSPNEIINLSLLGRSYDKDYHGLFASGFGDTYNTTNERGLYIALEALPIAKFKLQGFLDMYKVIWVNNRGGTLSGGYDYKLQLDYKHSQAINGYLQFYREENKRNTSSKKVVQKFLVKEKRTRLRLHFNYNITDNIFFKDRIEMSFYEKVDENYKGFMVYHDIGYKNDIFPVSFTTRLAWFDIKDYDARIYAYENDILYAFSILPFHNKGFRFYLNTKWNILNNLTLWAKYSLTKYSNRKFISSGMNLINDDKRQEIKFQLRYKF